MKRSLATKHKREIMASDAINAIDNAATRSVEEVMDYVYRTVRGDEWDTQPACWITDYILGVQCFVSVASVLMFTSDNERSDDAFWSIFYLVVMGATATLGGLLHHVAFKAQTRFTTSDADATRCRRVFGFYVTQPTVDRAMRWMWRFVLGLTTLSNFCLIAGIAQRHLSTHVSTWIIFVAAVAYSGIAATAFFTMATSIMLVGFLPPLCFGSVAALAALKSTWAFEVVALLFILAGGVIQAVQVSPSREHFNHNALAHLFLCASISTMTWQLYF
ncbi:hypothetical protein AC1031_006505 [Aphanomyces cochlioides]|nr:hypothetical protein AC1031_006505 [Aphanomyces cochlioides]